MRRTDGCADMYVTGKMKKRGEKFAQNIEKSEIKIRIVSEYDQNKTRVE